MPEHPADSSPQRSRRTFPGDGSSLNGERGPDPGERDHKPLLEHLRELRTTLIKIIAIFLVFAIVCLIAARPIAQALRMPLNRLEVSKGLEPGTITLITLGPQDGFVALMTIAFSAALGFSLPFALYFIGDFVRPGLTRRERRAIAPSLVIGLGLFVAGALFGFFVTSPLLMQFLWTLGERMQWQNAWTVKYYYGFLTQFLLVTGLTFELPLVLAMLVRLELLTVQQLAHYRRHAIVAILVASAVLTPPDAASMFLVAGPMVALYEVSILAGRIVRRRSRRSREEF